MILERLHEHIVQELQQNSRSESVFVLMSLLLNIITVAVNSGLASTNDSPQSKAAMVVLMALVIVVNMVAIKGLIGGRLAKQKLLAGLVKMYEQEGVSGFYDSTLLDIYTSRYKSYLTGVVATGIASFIIPIVVLVFKN